MNPSNRRSYDSIDFASETVIDTGIQWGLKSAKDVVDEMGRFCEEQCGYDPFVNGVNKIMLIKAIREAGCVAEQAFYQREVDRLSKEIVSLTNLRDAYAKKIS